MDYDWQMMGGLRQDGAAYGPDPVASSLEHMKDLAGRLRHGDAAAFTAACTTLHHTLALRVRGAPRGFHSQNQATAAAAGAFEALVEGLARHSGASSASRKAVVAGLAVANDLCAGNAGNRAAALRAGLLTPLLNALRCGATPDAEQAPGLAACAAIAMFAFVAHSPEVVRAALNGGAVDALLAVVKAYPPRSSATTKAFGALYNLASADPGAAARALSLGAVEVVAAALRGPAEADAQLAHDKLNWHASILTALLSHDASFGDATARMLRCGVVPLMLAAAQRQCASAPAGLIQPVVEALSSLSPALSYDERIEALQLLGTLLRMHGHDALFATAACYSLNDVLGATSSPAIALRCALSGPGRAAVPPLVAALRAHTLQHPNLAQPGCCAVTRLCAASPEVSGVAAVRCGVSSAVAPLPPAAFEPFGLAAFQMALRAAEKAHDAQPRCEPGEGEGACARCAEQRLSGALCGAPGCFARKRLGGTKTLLRCSACRVAAYCGEEHQRAAWAGHKQTCRAVAVQR